MPSLQTIRRDKRVPEIYVNDILKNSNVYSMDCEIDDCKYD